MLMLVQQTDVRAGAEAFILIPLFPTTLLVLFLQQAFPSQALDFLQLETYTYTYTHTKSEHVFLVCCIENVP